MVGNSANIVLSVECLSGDELSPNSSAMKIHTNQNSKRGETAHVKEGTGHGTHHL